MTIPRGLYTTQQLCEDVKNGDPVDLNDEQLISVAVAATSELRQRLPLSAIRQGDLPESYTEAAEFRRDVAHTLEDGVQEGQFYPPAEKDFAYKVGDKVVSIDGTIGVLVERDSSGEWWVKWEEVCKWQYGYHNFDAEPSGWTWESEDDLTIKEEV